MKVALVKLSNKRKGKFTWCIEINTTDMPRRKLMVKVCPKNAAEARPVNIVATVDEYFFNCDPLLRGGTPSPEIVSAV
jgi:hypothetical protein